MVFLPEIESLMVTPMPSKIEFVKKYSKKLPTFRLSKENYRQPVSMADAMVTSESYVESNIKIAIDPKEYGIFAGSSSYNADGSTKVKNIVYKDASQGFLFGGPCPPNGICPRCAPYRTGRSFY